MSLKAKIEAVIYAAEDPVTLAQLASLFSEEVLAARAAAGLPFDVMPTESESLLRLRLRRIQKSQFLRKRYQTKVRPFADRLLCPRKMPGRARRLVSENVRREMLCNRLSKN